MHKTTWKKRESKIAKIFGTFRTPLSGANSRHTRGDIIHNILFAEIKCRKNIPQQKLWEKTEEYASLENKTPLIIFIKKGSQHPLIFCKLSDIKKISGQIKNGNGQKIL